MHTIDKIQGLGIPKDFRGVLYTYIDTVVVKKIIETFQKWKFFTWRYIATILGEK